MSDVGSDAGEELEGRPDPQPGDNTTLTAVLAGYATEGFTEQFEMDASGAAPSLRCARCGETSRADEVSMPTTRARAKGLRTKQACSIPGRAMSSTKVPWPVSRRSSSTRGTRVPT